MVINRAGIAKWGGGGTFGVGGPIDAAFRYSRPSALVQRYEINEINEITVRAVPPQGEGAPLFG